jgi:hypothetical protein
MVIGPTPAARPSPHGNKIVHMLWCTSFKYF